MPLTYSPRAAHDRLLELYAATLALKHVLYTDIAIDLDPGDSITFDGPHEVHLTGRHAFRTELHNRARQRFWDAIVELRRSGWPGALACAFDVPFEVKTPTPDDGRLIIKKLSEADLKAIDMAAAKILKAIESLEIDLEVERREQIEPNDNVMQVAPSKSGRQNPTAHGENLHTTHAVFARHGDGYWIQAFGVGAHLFESRGLCHIFDILRAPDQEASILALFAGDPSLASDAEAAPPDAVLDRDAVRSIRKAVAELKEDLATAERNNDEAAKVRLRDELEPLEQHLKSSMGLGAKSRSLDKEKEGMRQAIRGNLKNAYKKLRDSTPSLASLADHFEPAIKQRKGFYRYHPAQPLNWSFDKN